MSFPDTTTAPIRAIFSAKQTSSFSKGELIIHAGEDSKYIYHIDKGFVKAYSITNQGFYSLLTIYVKDQLFPLPGLVKAAQENLFYEAMDDVAVRRVTTQHMAERVNQDMGVAQALLQQALAILGAYGERIENLEFRSARERVVKRLLFLSDRFGLTLKNGDVVIMAPVLHHDIADSVNASRETVTRILSALMRGNAIGIRGHNLVIRDQDVLEKIIEGGADD